MNQTTCRGCGRSGLQVVLDLGQMPLANAILKEEDLARPEPRYPLALAYCPDCWLVQITETVAPELLFRDYTYFSSVSDEFVEHSRAIAEQMIAGRRLGSDSLVVELASNDGYLLQHYARAGVPVLGIDPARNVAEVATERGVPTLAEFFTRDLADDLARSGRTADVVHANNVIAHVPDLNGFVAGIARILKPAGIAVIETPYLRELVERLEFDTIYHEHVFYHSLTALTRVFERNGLSVVDVERLRVHGGSLRLFAMRSGTDGPSEAARLLLAEEAAVGLCSPDYYVAFAGRVNALGQELRARLVSLRAQGHTVAAYGAAAKGAVLLNAFNLGPDLISFVVDRSPHKQGHLMPGVHIPIVASDQLAIRRPEECLLLAWNFADEILAQQAEYRRLGGKFIIPVPRPTLV
ncbi:MAG: class I SAM-dependent methyltransferase [Candidatus Limnocylindrales bacterium]|jgi:SAM-dependent methyltransferase